MLPFAEDTICAPATAPVHSSIAIIRLSGSLCFGTAQVVFSKPHSIKPRFAVYGSIINGAHIIDDVILTFYKSPHSYTGEDMVEIFCHGNPIIVSNIIKLLLKHNIRLAEPGEFTKRAFINGKLDLTEAEAVNHIISAKSNWEIETSIKQMHGSLRAIIHEIRDILILFKGDIEAGIDFIEEDIEFISREDSEKQCDAIYSKIADILLRCKTGEKIFQGINITIAGKPNVGKSSILNLFLNEERAIVSDIPGTTRDLIKETVQIDGIHVNLIDTAGIDTPGDELERRGIELSHKHIGSASLVLMVLDGTKGIEDADRRIFETISVKKAIYLINKTDIASTETIDSIEKNIHARCIHFSAKTGMGLKQVEKEISSIIKNQFANPENSFVADIRIISLLEKALDHIVQVRELIVHNEPMEIIAFELQAVLDALSEITGEISPDDVLNSIFDRFCIGK